MLARQTPTETGVVMFHTPPCDHGSMTAEIPTSEIARCTEHEMPSLSAHPFSFCWTIPEHPKREKKLVEIENTQKKISICERPETGTVPL